MELRSQTPQLDDGKIPIPFWSADSNFSSNFAWVRTAAQAAMALRVHGMLETTGMQSASARLQHASLPSFGKPHRPRGMGGGTWEDDEERNGAHGGAVAGHVLGDDDPFAACDVPSATAAVASNFEEGVVQVSSELQSSPFASKLSMQLFNADQ